VNSEQVGLESLAEAGERLCRPDISQELIPPLRSQNREELAERCLPVLSEAGTGRPVAIC